MTPQQQAYCNLRMNEISGGGFRHEAYVIDRISGLGSANLISVDPPVVGFGQDEDPYYQQYLHNWKEVNELINQIKSEAEKAWGKEPT